MSTAHSNQPWRRPRKGRKLTLKQIPAALVAHDRAQEASDRIRARCGLEPVPENQSVRTWRARLAEADLKRAPGRKRQSPAKPTEVVDPIAALRRAVAARQEAESRVAAALQSARESGAGMTACARVLGMSRQGAYKALERATA